MSAEAKSMRPDPAEIIKGKAGDDASVELSKFRTGMSEHRTDLSEHRTDLSEHRTGLADLRSHLANERTHLSYLRTGVSLVSFGITLNRFSLFLLQNEALAPPGSGKHFLRDTENVGLGMVVLGIILLLWSARHYFKVSRQIERASYEFSKWPVLILTFAVIALGAASTVWLMDK